MFSSHFLVSDKNEKVNTALKNNDAMVTCKVFYNSLPTATQYAFINTSMSPMTTDFKVKPYCFINAIRDFLQSHHLIHQR